MHKVLVEEGVRLRTEQTDDTASEGIPEAELPLLVRWRVTADAEVLPAWLTDDVQAQLADQVARAIRRTLGKARQSTAV